MDRDMTTGRSPPIGEIGTEACNIARLWCRGSGPARITWWSSPGRSGPPQEIGRTSPWAEAIGVADHSPSGLAPQWPGGQGCRRSRATNRSPASAQRLAPPVRIGPAPQQSDPPLEQEGWRAHAARQQAQHQSHRRCRSYRNRVTTPAPAGQSRPTPSTRTRLARHDRASPPTPSPQASRRAEERIFGRAAGPIRWVRRWAIAPNSMRHGARSICHQVPHDPAQAGRPRSPSTRGLRMKAFRRRQRP